MAALVKQRKGVAALATVVAIVLAVIGGVFAPQAQALDTTVYSPTKGTTTVTSTDFFETNLVIDQDAATDGFTVAVQGTSDYEAHYMTGLSKDAFAAAYPNAVPTDWIYETGLDEWDTWGQESFWRANRIFTHRYSRFADDNAFAIKFANDAAASAATIVVDYPYIGTYNGKNAGMKVTISNLQPQASVLQTVYYQNGMKEPAYQIAARPTRGLHQFNIHSADHKIELYYSDSRELIKANDIYITNSSLSTWDKGSHHISEKVKSLAPIEQVYIFENSNIDPNYGNSQHFEDSKLVDDNPVDGGYYYGLTGEDQKGNAYDDTVGAVTFPRNAVCFKYTDSTNIAYRTSTTSNSMWFTLYPQGLTSSYPGNPVKTVKVKGVKGVYKEGDAPSSIEAVSAGSTIEYVVDQQVNALGTNSIVRYDSFKMEDTVPAGVEIVSYEMTDENGEQLANNAGSFKVSGQTVTYTFDQGWLQANSGGMPMVGEHYQMHIVGKVSSSAKPGDVLKNSATSVINEKANSDQNHFKSNETETKVGEPVNDLVKLTNRDEVFTYTVSKLIPEDATKVTFSDKLRQVLEVVGEPTIDGAASYKINVELDKASDRQVVTAATEDASADAGKLVTLTIKAKVKESISDATLIARFGAERAVPNEATITIDDEPETTNEVKVIPPKKPEKKVEGKKYGTDEYATEKPLELKNRSDEFTYTVSQEIPEGATSVEFSDTLVPELKVIEATIDGAASYDVKVSGQTVTATTKNAKADAGKTVTLTIVAKIRDDVTDADLVAKYGEEREVPNEAVVRIDDNPQTTNEVKVVPPAEPQEDPEKFINDHKVPVLLLDRAEEFTYKVTQKIPSTAKSATFVDTLVPELTFVDGSWSVDGAASYDIKVEGQTITATSSDVTADRGKTVALVFKARIADGVSDATLAAKYGAAMLVPNVAKVSIDGNDPKTTNVVEVTPPAKDPEKEINGQKEPVTLANRDDVFTYTVTQVIPSGAANVTFTDVLESVLDIESAKLEVDGVEIPGAVTVTDQEVTAKITNATQMGGQTAVLTIQAVLREGTTDAELVKLYKDERQIPNKATVKINDDPKVTNEVLVTPPDEEGEDPIKLINGDTKLVELGTRPEVFTYSVQQKVPATATKIVITDTIEDVLEFAGTINAQDAYLNVLDEKVDTSTFAAEDTSIKIEGQTITATIQGEAAKAVRGMVVELSFKAALREGVTDAELIERYATDEDPDNRNIPNKATVAINDKPATETNTVYVVPPTEPGEDPVKKINDQFELVELENRDGNFVYTVTQKIPATATTATFTDTLEDVLEVVADDSELGYAVHINGSADYDISVDGKTVTATSYDVRADRGREITLTINAKIRDDVTDLDLVNTYGDPRSVPNKATVSIDDEPKTTNTVYVKPPEDPFDDPEKLIDGQKDLVSLGNRNDTFVYTVVQNVPATATKVVFADTLEDVLQVVGTPSIVVGTPSIDMNGASVAVEGNTVTATAEGDAVKAVRGKTVTLTIVAKIRDDVSELELVERYGDDMIVPNVATVSINDKPKTTNEVEVQPPAEEGDEPVKRINGGFDLVELENRYDGFTYTVSQLVPATAKEVTFTDVLEDVLAVEGTPEVDGAADYAISVDGNTVTAATADATADRGQVVTLTIRARIVAGVTDAELIAAYGDEMKVPNKATVTIDGKGKVTNKVEVTPPPEPADEPEKLINGQKELVKLANRDEVFTYTVTQKIPDNATTAAFEDVLKDELEVIEASVNAAADYSIQVVGQRVTATSADARADRGQVVTLAIRAKFRADVSDLDLVRKYGDAMAVPNQATVSINDYSKATNEVLVTPPAGPTEDPVKKVNGAESAELASRGEIFTYTVTQAVPAGATTMTFEDVLEDVLVVANATITAASGYDIAVDGNKVVAYTADATPDRGKVVTLTIQAKIRDDVSDEDLVARFGSTTVPNKATVSIDGDPRTTNTVTVTPPQTSDEEPFKTVNGKTHENLAAADEVFVYTVRATVPADATKFVISDTIEPVLAFASGEAWVDAGGGAIAVDGQTITATFEGDAAIALRGKSVALTFNAQIRDGADLSGYDASTVPNKASYTVNDDPSRTHETNTVTVTPPEPSEPPADADIVKAVNGVQHVNLGSASEVFNYTVTTAVPADADKVVVTDTLVPELEFASTADEVSINVTGDAVSARIDGQTLTVTIDGITDESGLRGNYVVVGFQAKVRDGADLSAYGNKAPNTASYTVNDDPARTHESNTVTVTPPGPSGNVDVVYLSTTGEILKATEVVVENGEVGSPYATNQLEFAGYRFVALDDASAPASGSVVEGWQHVIYLYEPVPVPVPDVYGNVDVVYVTTDGQVLKGVDIVANNQIVGTAYGTDLLEFPGYTFVGMSEQSADPSGLVEEGWKHVVYVYEPIPVPTGSVDVTYVTTDGQVLRETAWVVEDGEVGSPYTTAQYNFDGYRFVEMSPESAAAAGLVVEGIQHVIYVYEPIPRDVVGTVDVTYVTSDGTVLKETTMVAENQPVNTPYTTDQLEFDGYTFTRMDESSADASGVVEEGIKHVIYVYDPEEDIEITPGDDPVDNPNEDPDPTPTPEDPETPTTPTTPATPTTPTTTTPSTPTVQKTVTATPSPAVTPSGSVTPATSLATKTLDEYGPIVAALAAAAVLALAAGLYARRRGSRK